MLSLIGSTKIWRPWFNTERGISRGINVRQVSNSPLGQLVMKYLRPSRKFKGLWRSLQGAQQTPFSSLCFCFPSRPFTCQYHKNSWNLQWEQPPPLHSQNKDSIGKSQIECLNHQVNQGSMFLLQHRGWLEIMWWDIIKPNWIVQALLPTIGNQTAQLVKSHLPFWNLPYDRSCRLESRILYIKLQLHEILQLSQENCFRKVLTRTRCSLPLSIPT